MAWLRRSKNRAGTTRSASSADVSHLTQFLQSHQGVEAYLEPRTAVTETTVVLVAATGEWTRRRIEGPDAANSFARRNAIPLYDVAAVGYPQRMRDWTARRKASGELGPPGTAGVAP
ncbi:MAG: oxidoreductase [Jatrophihabitantaceae bacterium]